MSLCFFVHAVEVNGTPMGLHVLLKPLCSVLVYPSVHTFPFSSSVCVCACTPAVLLSNASHPSLCIHSQAGLVLHCLSIGRAVLFSAAPCEQTAGSGGLLSLSVCQALHTPLFPRSALYGNSSISADSLKSSDFRDCQLFYCKEHASRLAECLWLLRRTSEDLK